MVLFTHRRQSFLVVGWATAIFLLLKKSWRYLRTGKEIHDHFFSLVPMNHYITERSPSQVRKLKKRFFPFHFHDSVLNFKNLQICELLPYRRHNYHDGKRFLP